MTHINGLLSNIPQNLEKSEHYKKNRFNHNAY